MYATRFRADVGQDGRYDLFFGAVNLNIYESSRALVSRGIRTSSQREVAALSPTTDLMNFREAGPLIVKISWYSSRGLN